MKLENYSPSWDWMLLTKVEINDDKRTKGGIYLSPSSKNDQVEYQVVKIGEDCKRVVPGDKVKIDPRVSPFPLELEVLEGVVSEYFTLKEINQIGIERSK